ncbi:uncharacterized protein LOC113110576 [Carassius auratus]|uniref:Uncharacterized protein LOC113110576 n=1 Tax=Carassius auratus TaxID=7957 RepID=A0A6P6QAC6_CARAU|nr:uncharacterized protein LOC113110576 [Carassius auratus]
MELFIFIVFQLLMEVQSYKFPRVKVSPDVIRESSSVKISCETDPRVSVIECHFFINREEKKMKSSSSCELDLTGAEVFRWASVKSPESLNIICYTTLHALGSIISSPESDPVTVTVRVSTSTTTEQTTTTAMETSLTVMSTSEATTYSKTADLQTKINLPTITGKENRKVHSLSLNAIYSWEWEGLAKPDWDVVQLRIDKPATRAPDTKFPCTQPADKQDHVAPRTSTGHSRIQHYTIQ